MNFRSSENVRRRHLIAERCERAGARPPRAPARAPSERRKNGLVTAPPAARGLELGRNVISLCENAFARANDRRFVSEPSRAAAGPNAGPQNGTKRNKTADSSRPVFRF
jgi:hypothetical protein